MPASMQSDPLFPLFRLTIGDVMYSDSKNSHGKFLQFIYYAVSDIAKSEIPGADVL